MPEKLFVEYFEKGYLQHMKNSPLAKTTGLILVSCGDCDKVGELLEYEKDICERDAGHRRVHLLILNGGALCIHPESPLNQAGKSSSFMYDIKKTRTKKFKGIDDVAFYGHYECGEANDQGLQFCNYLFWLAMAAVYCQQECPDLAIACKIHIQVDEDTPFKTFYFDHLNFLREMSDESTSAASN